MQDKGAGGGCGTAAMMRVPAPASSQGQEGSAGVLVGTPPRPANTMVPRKVSVPVVLHR